MTESKESFAEISPADFFYRNRDIAGFTNPARAIYAAIRELVENSVPHDEPVLIQDDDCIKLVKIGELVDWAIEKNGVERNYPNGGEYSKVNGIKILTYNEKFQLTFKPLTGVFRHPSPKYLYEVETLKGRTVRTTSAHNIFVLKNEDVISKPTNALRIGDHLIVPRKSVSTSSIKTKVDLIAEMLKLPPEKTEKVRIYGISPLYDKLPRDWRKTDSIPFNFYRKNPVILVENTKLGVKQSRAKTRIPSILKVNEELMRILGYYSSEGFCINTKVSFSFGRQEKGLVNDLKECIKNVFGISANESHSHEGAINVQINSATLAFIFVHVFKLGSISSNKNIPNILFNVPRRLKLEYLRSYSSGDGYIGKLNTTVATSSEDLFVGLKYLLTMIGIPFTCDRAQKESRMVKSVKTSFAETYIMYIKTRYLFENKQIPEENFELQLLPINDCGLLELFRELNPITKKTNHYRFFNSRKCYRPKAHWRNAKKDFLDILQNRRNQITETAAQIIGFLEKFLDGDIGVLPVKKVNVVESNSRYVYDLCVKGYERFVGGKGIFVLHNSLDACELYQVPPEIYVRVSSESSAAKEGPAIYRLRVEDNGSGVPPEYIPSAFGQVLFGSKYRIRQTRGTFGLGGKMAILYGQITTHRPVRVISSTGPKIYEYELIIDIQRNRPVVLSKKVYGNSNKWHGTVVDFALEGDYFRAMAKILEYLKETAIVNPYANIMSVDPRGRLYRFERVTEKMPLPPQETLPHPYGTDVETIRRLMYVTECRDMLSFMTTHFHRVGRTIARRFLEFAEIGIKKKPKTLTPNEIVKLVQALKTFDSFLPPDASCLSLLGEDLLRAGIEKELKPEFIAVDQRKPSAYSGFPFVVECAIAYGGGVPKTGDIILYRFANRIPLLYDEASDVSWKVIHTMINWRHYRITPDMPIAVFVHVCSTKIPYKTVGKEFIADRPEVEKEILNGIREVARQLSIFLSRRESIEREKRRLDVFSKYLPKIAKFTTELAGREREPDIQPLLRSIVKYGPEEEGD